MAINKQLLEDAGTLILAGLGCDPNDRNFARTPERFANMLIEMFDPPKVNVPTFPEKCSDWVMMRGFDVWTMCPHHLVPVRLTISNGYIPNGDVIGASKLIRIARAVNRFGPLTQEKFGHILAQDMDDLIHGNKGIAVYITGNHGCMRLRGVKQEADMITSKFTGEFAKDYEFQNRFLDMVRSAHERR